MLIWVKAIWAAILEFFRVKNAETQPNNENRIKEINDTVEKADSDKLTELAIDSGLVQRPVDSGGFTSGSTNEDR